MKQRPPKKMTRKERDERWLRDTAAILGCKPHEVALKIKEIQSQQS